MQYAHTGTTNVNSEAVKACATIRINQLDDCSLHNTTLLCLVDDAASDDRAERCSTSLHHRYNCRRFQKYKSCEYKYMSLNNSMHNMWLALPITHKYEYLENVIQ